MQQPLKLKWPVEKAYFVQSVQSEMRESCAISQAIRGWKKFDTILNMYSRNPYGYIFVEGFR